MSIHRMQTATAMHLPLFDAAVSPVPTLSRCCVPVALLALAATLLVGCGGGSPGTTAVAAEGAALAPRRSASGPAVPVTTVLARQRDFPVILQAIGTAAPIAMVDVRAQVSSVVTKVHVREGQFVQGGELLFTLDSRSDEANVAKMRAQVAKDEAALADARRQLARSRELLAQNFVSQGAVDANQTAVESQAASVEGDRAALNAAEVALSYSKVTAPSGGRVGAISVYAGTAVQASQTSLVTITQLDPIDVSFSLPQRYLGNLLAALKAGDAPVSARLPEGGAELTGRLQFVDSAIDAGTGTVKAKARFENRASRLWPGAFVNVAMGAGTLKDAVVIPQGAIIQSVRGSIVYVVEKDRAVLRPVNVVESRGEDAAVTGVRGGERVVLDGRQNLRPDSPVVERAPEGPGTGSVAAASNANGSERTASASRAP
jgi:RND family efflux transporter MFP subunit